MKEIIIILLIFIANACIAQIQYDEVIVYLNTAVSTEGVVGSNVSDENEMRGEASFIIKIKDINEINDFVNLLLQNKYEKDSSHFLFHTMFLVDFMKDKRICKTIAINKFNNIRFDEESDIFKPNEKVSAFVKQYLSFFREIID